MVRRKIQAADIGYLRQIARATPAKRRSLLLRSNGKLLRLLSECCLNFLRQSYTVPAATIKKLKPYKTTIRRLARSRQPVRERRRALVQKGGFLPLLLPAAISFLANLIRR